MRKNSNDTLISSGACSLFYNYIPRKNLKGFFLIFFFFSAKPSKAGSKDDGTGFKAALLSGPPGVGKTTTAALVCKVSSS